VVLLGSVVLSKAIGFATTILLARALGTQAFGVLGTSITFLGFALVLTNFGSDAIGTREVAAAPERSAAFANGIRNLRLVLALPVSLGGLGVAMLLKVPLSIAIPLACVPWIYAFRQDWILVALSRERAVAISAILRELAFFGLAAVLAVRSGSVSVALWCFLAAELVQSAITQWAYRPGKRAGSSPSFAMGTTLRASAPLAFMGVMYLTYTRIDTPLVAFYAGPAAAGQYFAAYGVLFGLLSLVGPLARVGLPAISSARGRSEGEVGDFIHRLSLAACIGGAFLSLLVSMNAGLIVRTVYGGAYAEAANALRILAWSAVFTCASSLLLQRLVADGRQGLFAVISTTAAVVNIVCNLFWIPKFGIRGAALATIASEGCLLLLGMLAYLRRPETGPLAGKMAWTGASCASVWWITTRPEGIGAAWSTLVALSLFLLLVAPLLFEVFRVGFWGKGISRAT